MRGMKEARSHAQSRITSSHCNNLLLKSRSLWCVFFSMVIFHYLPNISVSDDFEVSCINVFILRSR